MGKVFGLFIGGIFVDIFNMSMMFIGMIILLSFVLLFLSFYDKVLFKNFKN